MTTQTPVAFSYGPETFRSLAQNLQMYRSIGHPGRKKLPAAPVVVDWSKTLLPFPGLIGTCETATVLEPVFAFSEDNSWALLAQGWVRLESHIDDRPDITRST